MYGKKAGTLQQEQTRLQHELQDVNRRIEKARKDGTEDSHALVAACLHVPVCVVVQLVLDFTPFLSGSR